MLKPEFREKAQKITVPEVKGVEVDEKPEKVGGKEEKGKEKRGGGGVPKWLRLPGKK